MSKTLPVLKFALVLQIFLIIFKIFGVVNLGWLWILTPIWLPFAAAISIFAILLIGGLTMAVLVLGGIVALIAILIVSCLLLLIPGLILCLYTTDS